MFPKFYAIQGYCKTRFAIPPLEGSTEYFMPTYEHCKLYFISLADALAYAQRYCSDFPWAIISVFTGSILARSSYVA